MEAERSRKNLLTLCTYNQAFCSIGTHKNHCVNIMGKTKHNFCFSPSTMPRTNDDAVKNRMSLW